MGDTGGRKLTNAVKQDLSDGSLILWWFLGVIKRSLISTLLKIHLGNSWWPGGRKGHKSYGHGCGNRAWGRHRYGNNSSWILPQNSTDFNMAQEVSQSHILLVATVTNFFQQSSFMFKQITILFPNKSLSLIYNWALLPSQRPERGVDNIGCPFGKKREKLLDSYLISPQEFSQLQS